MELKVKYITEEERKKCRKVAEAFAELYESGNVDIAVLDAGKYGFVKLQFYMFPRGFEKVMTFRDSMKLFDELWEEWLTAQLLALSMDTPMQDMDCVDIFKCLPKEKQRELTDKRIYFAGKAGLEVSGIYMVFGIVWES